MLKEIRRGVLFTVVTMILFGGGYHLLMRGIGLFVFPRQAEGSLIRRADGTLVGSSLIAQSFTQPQYFHPRPSAVDYNAASTGGSNFGPSNPDHLKLARERLDGVMATEGVPAAKVPSEMITASGGGLDPHIPPNAAELQVARVARARHVDPARIRELVRAHTDSPFLGVFGRSRVNVLELNLALDQEVPGAAGSRHSAEKSGETHASFRVAGAAEACAERSEGTARNLGTGLVSTARNPSPSARLGMTPRSRREG